MKKVYLIPNLITAFGLSCGLFVIFKTTIYTPSEHLFVFLQTSVFFLLLAAVADLADGAIARLIKAQSDFGGQFDSLSDAVTFGVAPPVLALKSFAMHLDRLHSFFFLLAAMIFALCGILRLVRYTVHNVLKNDLIKAPYFIGLPIPAAAACVLSLTLLFASNELDQYIELTPIVKIRIFCLLFVFLGSLMIGKWKFPSMKTLHIKVPSLYLIFGVGLLATLLLYGIQHYFVEAFFLVSWIYVLIAVIVGIIASLTRRSHKDSK